MAKIPLHSCSGHLGLHFSCALLAFWCTFVGSGSALKVTQTPSFVSGSTGQSISFSCSVDEAGYRLYLYHQLPGKTELKELGYLSTSAKFEDIPPELTNRLKGEGSTSANRAKREMRLELSKLQANDKGLYLCAAVAVTVREGAYFATTGTQLLVTDPKCDNQPSPSVVLLKPLCHKKRIILVCLAQGFHYGWPLDVIWEHNGNKITRPSFATQPIQKRGECSFATASRLSVLAEEWQKGHNYSCQVNQAGLVVGDLVKGSPDQKTESTSGISEVQLSLYAGQFIFLLLGAKSLAYSVILGIYKFYRKKGL